ncbi:MFS transporter [Chryseobacterium antibioticum]|uniref:MFS transporter n=1 Tax=Chryseobacterium pyrolae TaxID=2987481 RepID=A0ABT2IEJ1_9FLAO|nr:MFS transporter [Chryseobacterium pyrolae]MCT2406778.1 MFS transporter [Chryseobacterium pyrolae]
MNTMTTKNEQLKKSIPFAIWAIAFCAFGIGTTEFVLVGLLPTIASNLAISISSTGSLITLYALGVAIGGPIFTVLTGKIEQKKLLLLTVAVFIIGNTVAFFAKDILMLQVSRVITGTTHGVFFGYAVIIASNMVTVDRKATAISLVFTGLMVSKVIGVPLGTYIGSHFGWKITFLAVIVWGIVGLLILSFTLPKQPKATETLKLKDLPKVFRNRSVLIVLLANIFAYTGTFILFTYLSPILEKITGFSLDTTAKNATGTSTNADGILIPRVDRQRALSMTSVEPSTLIYVNNISTGTTTGQASNIDAIGFYYFDGSTSKWTKLNIGGVTADFTPDAFIDDSANSMVKLGANSSGGSRASGSDFVIKDNGRVGIGTTSPSKKLDVKGDGIFSGAGADVKIESLDNVNPSLSLYHHHSGTNLSTNSNVGRVSFKGRVNGAEQYLASIKSTYLGSGTDAKSDLNFSVNGIGTTSMILSSDGYLGVGTISPTERLDVNGNARFRLIPNVQKDALFYKLGVNAAGDLAKETSISSYNTYLGFNPAAPTHTKTIPLTLENGYLTKISGTSIGACMGVMVDFTIYFIGTSYLGASLQARATSGTTTFAAVTLSSSQSIFGTSLERLANASGCSASVGHILSYSAGQITVSFFDQPTYFTNAGLFVIYSIDKVKQTN